MSGKREKKIINKPPHTKNEQTNEDVSPQQLAMSKQEGMDSCKFSLRLFISLNRPSMRRGVEVQASL